MESVFSAVDFTNVCKFISCRGLEEFAKMYEEIGFYGKSYAEEKYNCACTNFINWWCNLDFLTQENIIKYVKNYYKAYSK